MINIIIVGKSETGLSSMGKSERKARQILRKLRHHHITEK